MTMAISFQILEIVFIRQNSKIPGFASIYLPISQRITKIIRQNSSRPPESMNQIGFQRIGIFLAIEFLVGARLGIRYRRGNRIRHH